MIIVALMYGMMPSAPTAQCSSAPPVNKLYIPSTDAPAAAWSWTYCANTPPSRPGMRTTAASRQIASTIMVNRIRDFSSGILKQLLKVLAIAANMDQLGSLCRSGLGGRRLGGLRLGANHHLAGTPTRFDLRASRGAEGVRDDRQFARQIARPQNLDAGAPAIGQPGLAQHALVNARSIFELVQALQVYWQVTDGMAGIVEAPLGNAPDQRHLAAFEPDPDRTARSRRLAFATASAGLAMPARFALSQPLAAVPGARTRL